MTSNYRHYRGQYGDGSFIDDSIVAGDDDSDDGDDTTLPSLAGILHEGRAFSAAGHASGQDPGRPDTGIGQYNPYAGREQAYLAPGSTAAASIAGRGRRAMPGSAGTLLNPIAITSSPATVSTPLVHYSTRLDSTPPPRHAVIRAIPSVPARMPGVDATVQTDMPALVTAIKGYFEEVAEDPDQLEVVPPPPEVILPKWVPPPNLSKLAIPAVQSAINRIAVHSPCHLLKPRSGQQYLSSEAAEQHLHDWSFTQCFAVVVASAHRDLAAPTVGIEFACIHHKKKLHGSEREALEDHASEEALRDVEYRRSLAQGCKWSCYLGYHKKTGLWVLNLREQHHSHPLSPNPLRYDIHRARNPSAARAFAIAKEWREKGHTWRSLQRELHSEGLELEIQARQFWNMRKSAYESEALSPEDQRIEDTLTELGFKFDMRCSYEVDDCTGYAIRRQIEQVVFWLPEQEDICRRFMTDFCVIIDATFNTNRTRLLLGMMTGMSNVMLTAAKAASFPGPFSYFKSESRVNWEFFIEVASRHCWIRPPKVTIADSGAGLISVFPQTALGGGTLQRCIWHLHENLKKRISSKKNGYEKEKRAEIYAAGWAYLKAETTEDLDVSRSRLYELLKADDRMWLDTHWRPFEAIFVKAHVK